MYTGKGLIFMHGQTGSGKRCVCTMLSYIDRTLCFSFTMNFLQHSAAVMLFDTMQATHGAAVAGACSS